MKAMIPDYMRGLPLAELVELALRNSDEPWFWYLTGWVWSKLPPDHPSGIALFDAAHVYPADYQKALKALQELET